MTERDDTPLGAPPPAPLLTDEERASLTRERAAAHSLYERLIGPLVEAQNQSQAHLRAVAVSHRAMAAHRRTVAAAEEAIAKEHEALAAAALVLADSVPLGDQAAADLGTASEHHDYANLRMVIMGEHELAARLEARLDALAAAYEADRARATRERRLILQALSVREDEG